MAKVWVYHCLDDHGEFDRVFQRELDALDAEVVGALMDLMDRHITGDLLATENLGTLDGSPLHVLVASVLEEYHGLLYAALHVVPPVEDEFFVALCTFCEIEGKIPDTARSVAERRLRLLVERARSITGRIIFVVNLAEL